MPDLEISNLPALAEAGVSANDPLAIADVSASETKKVTVKDLIEAGVALIDTGSIPSAKIAALAANQVATTAIQNNAVTNAKLEHSTISLGGISIALGGTDATPAFNLADATGYTTANLSGTISNAQLAGSIANNKLANSSVSFGGISLALGGTDATPAFDLQDATGYKTTNLVGTITNAQLAGSIANSKLVASSVSLGGVSITLGGTDATPAFNLTDATGYPTSSLVGTITNSQLAGSIANSKLVNSSVSFGGVSVALGATDNTPAFNLTDATGYPASSLVGTITNAQLAGSIDVSKLSGSTSISLGGVTLALGGTDATPAFNLSDATHYPASALVGTITNAQLAGSIANSKLANSSVSLGGVSVALGSSDSTPAFDLTDATGYKTTNLIGTITNAQLAGSIDVSKLVGSNVNFGGVTVALGGSDTTPAFNLTDATNYPASALVGTITNAQLAGSIAATKLVSGSITSTQLAANSVTSSELANDAVDTGAVQNGAITNDKIETSTSATTGLDGATKIRDASITPAKLNNSNLDRSLNVASGNLGINNVISAATRSGITYNAQGLITGTVALAAADLPVATSSAVGGVSIAAGLSVNGAGALSLTNSVTGATVSGITFNNQGMITAATALVAGDLPVSTTSAKGAVQITSGGGLTVDGSGNLTTSTSGVSAGTYQSVTVNNKGVITAGAALTAGLVPNLAASQITSGSFAAARIAADSIDGTKLSNASTAIFQSIAQSGYPTAQFNGQLLFDTVSEDAFIWDGNAWQAITTLTKGSLVFGGTYNASTSKMASTTTAGIAAGLAVGSNLPSPSSTTDGLYVVVDVAGTPSAPAPVVSLSPPDYILGVTNTAGSSWNEIDLSQTVAGQVASNITFTPYGQISATNLQDALQELETEKLAKAGGTVTGELLIGNTGSFVFEGSTVDAYETRITVADPTSSDKTITFPDTTGTVVTTGDTGTVTSTMLANGTIVNADINASAAIALTKLANVTAAQIIVGNGSNVPTAVAVTGDISINNAGLTAIAAGVIVDADISGSAAITGSKIATGTTSAVGVLQLTDSTTSTSATTAATPAAVKIAKDAADAAAATANAALPKAGGTLTDNLIIDNGKELRLSEADSDGANYTGLKAQAQSANIVLTLPAVAPTTGQVLKSSSTATTLEWAADSATDATKMPLTGGTFTGDVTFTGDSSNGLWDKSASAFVANLTGNVTGNVTGTAGSLASSVNIGGVSFDGSASINLPGVNAAGNQDTSGTAALATEFTVTANNSTNETVYPLFVDGATGSQGGETDSALTYNPSTGALTTTTFIGAVTGNVTGNVSGTSGGFTAGDASNLNSGTVATARLGSGTASSSNFLRGDNSWQTIDLTNLSASNLTSGTVNVARLGSGSSVSTKFLRGDNTWQTISITPEGTAILSTGESGGTKFLREDGDGTCSWQAVVTSAAGSNTQVQFNNSGSFAGSSSLTFNSASGALTATSFVGDLTGVANTATQVSVTSGTSNNADYYLPFFSGDAGAKALNSDPNLRWNPSTNTLTVTNFVGALTGDVTGNVSGSSGSCTGNAATATALATARAIGGVNFDGTAPINLPGVNTAGNQNTSGNAATATKFAATVNINGVAFDGSADVTVTAAAGTLTGSTLASGVTASSLTSVGTLTSLAVTNNATIGGNAVITGDLTVNGTTTTIDTTTLQVEDKNIEIGKVSSPSDATADGGGLTLLGATNKTWNWVNSTDAWTSSEHIQVASGKTFIGDGSTLTALNASNIASGTIAAARVPTLNQNTTGSAGSFTAGSASNLNSGTLPDARFPSTLPAASAANLTNVDADTVTISNNQTDATFYPVFVNNNGSGRTLNLDQSGQLNYNPYTNNLVAGTFSGSGAGLSNVDATTLDGIDSGSFLRSDTSDNFTGSRLHINHGSNDYPLLFDGTSDAKILLKGSNAPYIRFRESDTDKAYIQWTTSGFLQLYNQEDDSVLRIKDDITFSTDGGSTNHKVWHAGNDGAGSGLDADTLDGVSSGSFLRGDIDDTTTGHLNFSRSPDEKFALSGSSNPFFRFNEGTTNKAYIQWNASGYLQIENQEAGAVLRVKDDLEFSSDSASSFNSIVHQGNVGSGGVLSSKNVYVNQIHGDGSNLTNLPASGGTITATASGALAAGDKVIVNTDGTVSSVVETFTRITSGGSDSADNSGDAEDFAGTADYKGARIAYVPTGDYYVVVYQNYINNSNRYLRARALTVDSSGSITVGSEYQINGTRKAQEVTCVYDPDQEKVLIMYTDSESGYLIKTRYVSSSDGSTLSFGSNTTVTSSGTATALCIAYNTGINKFMMGYKKSDYYRIRIGTSSGSSVSWTSESTVESNEVENCMIEADATSSFVCYWRDRSGTADNNHPAYRAVSVSGTTPSVGSKTVMSQEFQGVPQNLLVFDKNEERFLLMAAMDVIGTKIRVLTVSGNSTTSSSDIGFASNSAVPFGSLVYDPYIKEVYLHYANASNSSRLTVRRLKINSGTSVGIYGAVEYSTLSASNFGNNDIIDAAGMQYMAAAGATHHLFTFKNQSGDSGWVKAVKVAESTSNLTAENYIGTSKAAYSNSATATINVSGSLDENQSSLTAGQKYYVQANGTLGLAAGTTKVFAGTAVSSTKLLVNDQQPIPSASTYGLVIDEWFCRGGSAVAAAARPTTSTYLNGSGWTGNDGKMYRTGLWSGATGVSWSNEVISFPSTGTWKIEWSGYATSCSSEIRMYFYASTNGGSGWSEKKMVVCQDQGNDCEIPFYMTTIFEVTNTSNDKFRIRAYGSGSSSCHFAAGNNDSDPTKNTLLFTKVV